MKKLLIMFFLCVMLVQAASIKVKYVGGVAYLQRANKDKVRITVNIQIYPGDTVVTEARSFVALVTSGKSVHKVTANTTYKVEKFEENQGVRLQVFKIKKGKVFNYISKSFKKSNIKFVTPTAIVGVRGTAFAISHSLDLGTSVYLTSGQVDVGINQSGQSVSSRLMNKGNVAKVSPTGVIKVELMDKGDYEQAAEGVPVQVAKVELTSESESSDDFEENESEELKKEIRIALAQENERISEISKVTDEKKTWDHEFNKQVGPYQVRQFFRKVDDKNLILDTYYKGRGNIKYLLGISLSFLERVPNLEDKINNNLRKVVKSTLLIRGTKGEDENTLLYKNDEVANQGKGVKTVHLNGKLGEIEVVTPRSFISGGGEFIKSIPKDIKFKLGKKDYKFIFEVSFIDGATDSFGDLVPTHQLSEIRKGYVREKVLSGDLVTKVRVLVSGNGDNEELKVFNHYSYDSNKSKFFDLIMLNDYLVPLLSE